MRKPEFSKLILGGVMILYFAGAVFGAVEVEREHASTDSLLDYIRTPTMVAIGFYCWKSKAENVLKISDSEKTKQKIVNGAFKSESEGYGYGYNYYNEGGNDDGICYASFRDYLLI